MLHPEDAITRRTDDHLDVIWGYKVGKCPPKKKRPPLCSHTYDDMVNLPPFPPWVVLDVAKGYIFS